MGSTSSGPVMLSISSQFISASRPCSRSDTYWKDRVCEPSPYSVSESPRSACLMKLETTRPSSGSMRGPKVLKMRAMRTDTPSLWYS